MELKGNFGRKDVKPQYLLGQNYETSEIGYLNIWADGKFRYSFCRSVHTVRVCARAGEVHHPPYGPSLIAKRIFYACCTFFAHVNPKGYVNYW